MRDVRSAAALTPLAQRRRWNLPSDYGYLTKTTQ